MTTHTASSSLRTSGAAMQTVISTNGRPHPPREVWPLLVTIGVTELTMAGIIFWFSAPTVAPAALAGLGIGTGSVAMLALVLWLTGKLAAPTPTVHAGSRTR